MFVTCLQQIRNKSNHWSSSISQRACMHPWNCLDSWHLSLELPVLSGPIIWKCHIIHNTGRTYVTYRDATRGGPSHGHTGNMRKIWSSWDEWCLRNADRLARRRTDGHARYSTHCPCTWLQNKQFFLDKCGLRCGNGTYRYTAWFVAERSVRKRSV